MPSQIYIEPICGASGDMLLGAMLDILGCGIEFRDRFQSLGLSAEIHVRPTEKNHLRCTKVDVETRPNPAIRHPADICAFIAAAPFSETVKEKASAVFERIFTAEASVHGEAPDHVHLHELGADDSLIDILGFCWLWEKLEFAPIVYSTLVTGRGQIRTQHGLLPVPPPAVLKLIEGNEFRTGDIETEVLTPTGAALLTTLGKQVGGEFLLRPIKTGIGAGDRSFPQVPNIVRVILTESAPLPDPAIAIDEDVEADQIWVLETFLDDLTGEQMGYFQEKMTEAGALDLFITQGIMKKGRPGYHVTALCRDDRETELIAAVFRESSAIGLRRRREHRLVLRRESRSLPVEGVDVSIKTAYFKGQPVNRKPEFEDLRRLVREQNLTLKQAAERVRKEIDEQDGSK